MRSPALSRPPRATGYSGAQLWDTRRRGRGLRISLSYEKDRRSAVSWRRPESSTSLWTGGTWGKAGRGYRWTNLYGVSQTCTESAARSGHKCWATVRTCVCVGFGGKWNGICHCTRTFSKGASSLSNNNDVMLRTWVKYTYVRVEAMVLNVSVTGCHIKLWRMHTHVHTVHV